MRAPENRATRVPGRTFEEELNLRYLSPGAFTVLSPEDHGSPPDPPQAPTQYRLSPTARRNRNQAFSIIAEPSGRSRSPSPPSGRVSPFRGRGFNASGSRHASPAPSPPPPPEDSRISSQPLRPPRTRPTNINKKTQIPQLKRRGSSSIIITDDSDSSPKYRRKNATSLKPQLSKSLNYIGPKKVPYKPPPSPRKLYSKTPALSPIIGSSPEPSSDSKSQSSPSRIPKSRSTPPSRRQSPNRESSPEAKPVTRSNSRVASRNNSRNPSREPSPSGKPPFSPTRIPVRNYKNVQAKVNSYNAKTPTTKPKVPTKTQEIRNRIEENNKTKVGVERRNSVNKNVSKNNSTITNKTSNNNNSNSRTKLNETNSNTTKTSTARPTNRASTKTKKDDKDNNNTTTSTDESAASSSEKVPKTTKPTTKATKSKTGSTDNLLKKVASVPKLTEMLPTTVVSTTTSTVTQPLKIEAKLETKQDPPAKSLKETPMYMDEGRVLSAKSVSSAIERMNDTVLDSHTLMKDHNMTKLSPAANTIISMSHETGGGGATVAVPSVETPISRPIAGQVVNSIKEDNANNNIGKLISPDDSFGAKVNSFNNEKSANERMKEARTMVASDVKPIKITVQEKPNDAEVQSGNVRFPPSVTNGVTSGAGVPPPQGANGNGNHPEPPPKSRCGNFVERCREKMTCLKPKTKPLDDVKKSGYFGCLKKKKKDEIEEIIVSDAREAAEAAKKASCLERLRCCRSNKVGDETTGCCGRNKRKDSWTERRDSILSEPPTLTRGMKCKNFFKKLFCCCGCSFACSRCCKPKPPKMEDSASRRASLMSKKKSLTPTVLPPEDPKDKLDTSLVEYTSTMKAAIPVLPVCLAYFCLFLNIFAPGTGTVFSGLFCLCMGKPRFSQRDGPKPRLGSFIINIFIGCGQLFTVLFCLVGWGWSIWWGVIMIKIAKKHRKLKKIEERLEAQQAKTAAAAAATNAAAAAAANAKRDVEKGRS